MSAESENCTSFETEPEAVEAVEWYNSSRVTMGPKAEPKKSKAELKAEALAEAERLAAIAEQERIEQERLAAEQYAHAQEVRKGAMEECSEEIERQQDAEESANFLRESHRQRLYEAAKEVAEWKVCCYIVLTCVCLHTFNMPVCEYKVCLSSRRPS